MKKYNVTIQEILQKTVTVEANNTIEAENIVKYNYVNENKGYILTADDHVDTIFIVNSMSNEFTFKEKFAACVVADKILTAEHFSLKIDNDAGEFYLFDKEKANLADIQSEKFPTLMQVIDRLDNYHDDYFFESDDAWDRMIRVILKSNYFANLLECIDSDFYENYLKSNEYHSLNLNSVWFEESIIEKIIALRTINTLSAYVIVEYNDKIYVSDYAMYDNFENPKDSFLCDIIEFENGKRNQLNFQKYNTYRGVVDNLIPQIKEDLKDLGFKDFYLSEDELKYLNISEDLWKN